LDLATASLLLFAGLCAGFLAGLFGIGGGVVLIPIYWFLFDKMGASHELSVKLSVATTLATIAVTTLFTSLSHLSRGNIEKRELLRLFAYSLPGIAAGVFLASKIPALLLKKLFAALLVITGLKTFSGKRREASARVPKRPYIIPLSVSLSAFLSALLGIGGGIVVNSILLNASSLSAERVVAIASLSSFINALLGALLYLFVPAPKLFPFQIGLVYLPAALLVSVGAVAGSKVGLFLLDRLNRRLLKRAFALLLIVVGVKIIFA